MESLPSEVYCDFDGTITSVDATDAILEEFALPAWREWEARWVSGEISSRECLARQVDLLRTDRKTLLEFAETLAVDRGILNLQRRCSAKGVRLTVVSDGLDLIAQAVLGRLGLSHLPLFANRVVWTPAGTCALEFPQARPECESGSGTCKCFVTGALQNRRPRIFIGDGRSDFCVAGKISTVFAKGSLRKWCASQSIPYHPYETLDEVAQVLFSSEASAR